MPQDGFRQGRAGLAPFQKNPRVEFGADFDAEQYRTSLGIERADIVPHDAGGHVAGLPGPRPEAFRVEAVR
ncbi:MAG: hypothetical protein A49_03530 [Methyloceanibacter sp.]|nr:MAG: hypothetical protein A49_03530 [Methyloceanibacter sp.]